MKDQRYLEYSQAVRKVLFRILLFILHYLFILTLSLAAFLGLGYVLLIFMLEVDRLEMLVFAFALISPLGFIVLFLIKILFSVEPADLSGLHEIKAKDHPKLFDLIQTVVRSSGTRFPSKVYLTFDTNASVMSNPGFFNTFVLNRKSLIIGIGLMNSLNESELKSVLAHEFGHFSQKSSKVYSFIYRFHAGLFQLIYNNRALKSGNQFTKLVMEDFILKNLIKSFDSLNKNYMNLSREMEYHADEFGVRLVGYQVAESALLRLSFSQFAFESLLNFYFANPQKTIERDNIYEDHSWMIAHIATDNQIKMNHGFPNIQFKDIKRLNRSKLVFEDQWASHPRTEDRIEQMRKTGIPSSSNHETPSVKLLHQPEEVLKMMSSKFFQLSKPSQNTRKLNRQEFIAYFLSEKQKNSLPKIYNDYYNYHIPILQECDLTEGETSQKIQSFYSDQMIETASAKAALNIDISNIEAIQAGFIETRYFDYDGVKYTVAEIPELLKKLQNESSDFENKLRTNDQKIFRYFLNIEKQQKQEAQLAVLYEKLENFNSKITDRISMLNELRASLNFIFFETDTDTIQSQLNQANPLELQFKNELRNILNLPLVRKRMEPETLVLFDRYVHEPLVYFDGRHYHQENIDLLVAVLNQAFTLISDTRFYIGRELLEYQASLITD